jgi:hypothetical protein
LIPSETPDRAAEPSSKISPPTPGRRTPISVGKSIFELRRIAEQLRPDSREYKPPETHDDTVLICVKFCFACYAQPPVVKLMRFGKA